MSHENKTLGDLSLESFITSATNLTGTKITIFREKEGNVAWHRISFLARADPKVIEVVYNSI